MGMSIDEAINHLGNYSSTNGSGLTTDKQHNEAKRVAIDTMRKYQKIEQIWDKWHIDISVKTNVAMSQIGEVLKDGKIN